MPVSLSSAISLPGIWTAISSGTGAMDVNNIPTGYKFLKVIIVSAVDGASHIDMNINADAGANYFYSTVNNGVHAESATTMRLFSGAGVVVADLTIQNIASATKNVCATLGQYIGGASQSNSYTACGTWTNTTDEISRITLTGTPVYWALLGMALP